MASAKIELPTSKLTGPILLSSDEFGIDDFDAENKAIKVENSSKISKTKAVLLSLVVPGAGHYYVGSKGRGQVFMGAEALTWFGFFAFRTYGSWKKDDYKDYAVQYAGITESGHDDDFYRNLIFYDSRDEYNRSGRIINPGSVYYPDSPEYDWFWESEVKRTTYRDLRNSSEDAYRKATFMLGIALFNRIVAGIDAFRIAQKESNKIKEGEFLSLRKIDIDIKADPFGSDPNVGITLKHRF